MPGGELTLTAWLWLALAGVLVGVAKTAVNGVGSIAIVIFAAVLPARESTGAILPLLLCGDVLAVAYYRRHADWGTILRLLPGVLPGLVVGAWFLSVVDDVVMRRAIAVILLVMCAAQLWQLLHRAEPGAPGTPEPRHGPATVATGVLAGFTTMTANAAGPVTTVYLIRAGLPMLRMIGTGAWFYLVVNLAKVPFSASLGLITPASLLRDALLVPALLVGAVLGILLVGRLRQRQFEVVAVLFSAAASVLLLA
ncbi:MAG: sulfite exporter TauE/SafE family protein [Marmoricola sp.]|nr:sulfite exporter TauE/SafE family protein [Marmoricola sp.]